jgi:hypothetical protein
VGQLLKLGRLYFGILNYPLLKWVIFFLTVKKFVVIYKKGERLMNENNGAVVVDVPQMHVRYEGQSWDIPLSELDVGDRSTDQQIREAVAARLNAPAAKLRNFAIDRNANGEMTLRPEATFGQG